MKKQKQINAMNEILTEAMRSWGEHKHFRTALSVLDARVETEIPEDDENIRYITSFKCECDGEFEASFQMDLTDGTEFHSVLRYWQREMLLHEFRKEIPDPADNGDNVDGFMEFLLDYVRKPVVDYLWIRDVMLNHGYDRE